MPLVKKLLAMFLPDIAHRSAGKPRFGRVHLLHPGKSRKIAASAGLGAPHPVPRPHSQWPHMRCGYAGAVPLMSVATIIMTLASGRGF